MGEHLTAGFDICHVVRVLVPDGSAAGPAVARVAVDPDARETPLVLGAADN